MKFPTTDLGETRQSKITNH